jgi:hypothetical protein
MAPPENLDVLGDGAISADLDVKRKGRHGVGKGTEVKDVPAFPESDVGLSHSLFVDGNLIAHFPAPRAFTLLVGAVDACSIKKLENFIVNQDFEASPLVLDLYPLHHALASHSPS